MKTQQPPQQHSGAASVQVANFELVERIGATIPTLNNVRVGLAMGYDLVQMLNRAVFEAQNARQQAPS